MGRQLSTKMVRAEVSYKAMLLKQVAAHPPSFKRASVYTKTC
jgi:hypothetical protein